MSRREINDYAAFTPLPFSPYLDLRCCDCMDLMRECADKAFDLAIVDPPYGINAAADKRGGKQHGAAAAPSKSYGAKTWDAAIPPPEYFQEVKRVSRHQIIWSGNYFNLPPSRCWIVWDKLNAKRGYPWEDNPWVWVYEFKVERFKK